VEIHEPVSPFHFQEVSTIIRLALGGGGRSVREKAHPNIDSHEQHVNQNLVYNPKTHELLHAVD
jgi:hypothetical protein